MENRGTEKCCNTTQLSEGVYQLSVTVPFTPLYSRRFFSFLFLRCILPPTPSFGFWRLNPLVRRPIGNPSMASTTTTSISELDEDTVRSMAVGAVFTDFGGKINSVDFHRKDDLLVTASEDDSVRLYDIASAKLLKTTFHKKHGADRICFTHHPSSVICSSKYNLETSGESLRYLSMYDNRCLRYFKGHSDRVVSLCMSPINDSFMSGSLDHSVRIWDLRVNACQGILRLRGRPTVAYDQQGLVFAVAMEGGAIKLFDSRSYDKGPFDTFLVGGDTAEVCDIKFSNDGKSMLLTTTSNSVYVLDAYAGEKVRLLEYVLRQLVLTLWVQPGTISKHNHRSNFYTGWTVCSIRIRVYCLLGSGDGTLRAWNINRPNEQVACWNSHIGVANCLKWAPRRVMFVAASSVLTFWIPDTSKPATAAELSQPQPPRSMDNGAGTHIPH
ncbi:Protein ANTHESIS POMOTING FACTOR 1 [Linum perenne]